MSPKSVKKMKLTFKHTRINTDMSRTILLEDFSMKQGSERHDTAAKVSPAINLCPPGDDGPTRNASDQAIAPPTSEFITRKEVESWINNKKAKVTRKRFKKSLKPRKKKLSAGMNTSAAVLKEANNAWKNLKGTPSVEKYKSMAEKANKSTPASLLPHEKDLMKKKVVKEIQKLCKMLNSFGSEAYFVSCDEEGSIFTAGTTLGQQFLEREKDVVRRFGYQVVGTVYHGKPTKNSRESLVQQVQELFNEKYCVATGKKRFSYKQLALGHIKMIGMPEGLCCKRPSAYGVKDLERLLENRNSLSVVVVDEHNRVQAGGEGNTTDIRLVSVTDQVVTDEHNHNRVQAEDHTRETPLAGVRDQDEHSNIRVQAEEDNTTDTPLAGVILTDQAECTTEMDNENANPAPITEGLSEIFHEVAKTSDKKEGHVELYPIEKNLRKRRRKGVLEYRVKWHGYANKYNQWVAETSISRDDLQNHNQTKQTKRLRKGIKKGHSKN